jgi:hypothetical protein
MHGSERVYLSNRQSMTIRAYLNSRAKRTETPALLDCGATENFMSEDFARSLDLPI